MAKQPIKHALPWYSIKNAGAVYGDKEVTIKGKKYKIRLLRGYNESVGIKDLTNKEKEYRGNLNVGSEWNRLLYPISNWDDQSYTYHEAIGSKIPFWANYGQEELGFKKNYNGARQWCQETSYDSASRLYRGNDDGVSYSSVNGAGGGDGDWGWRPALDFIPQ